MRWVIRPATPEGGYTPGESFTIVERPDTCQAFAPTPNDVTGAKYSEFAYVTEESASYAQEPWIYGYFDTPNDYMSVAYQDISANEREYTITILQPVEGLLINVFTTPLCGTADGTVYRNQAEIWEWPVESEFVWNIGAGTAEGTPSTFTIHKELAGDVAQIPSDTVFDVDYTWSAPNPVEGEADITGSGTLEVKADGTPVESPVLPVEATVKISESNSFPVIVGAETGVWGEPTYDPGQTIRVNPNYSVHVTITNTFTAPEESVPSEPDVPADPADPAEPANPAEPAIPPADSEANPVPLPAMPVVSTGGSSTNSASSPVFIGLMCLGLALTAVGLSRRQKTR
jgi:hypothetical protein